MPVELLTKAEYAERMKVNVSTVERWMANGKLIPDARTPGGYPRFAWPPTSELRKELSDANA